MHSCKHTVTVRNMFATSIREREREDYILFVQPESMPIVNQSVTEMHVRNRWNEKRMLDKEPVRMLQCVVYAQCCLFCGICESN